MSSTRLQRFRSVLADTRPLRNPAFRRLWIADIVTVVGAQLTIVSVPAQIYAQTRDSSYVGLTGLFGLVPLIVFGLYGGSLADAHDRRRILLFTSGGLVVASALFWAQAAAGGVNVWVLLCLFAAQQALFALHQPALQSSLPRLLEPELLPAANSLLMTVAMAGGIAGPLLAGALIPVLGFSWMYAIDTICLLSTLWAVFRMPALPPIGEVVKAGFSSVLDGLRYLTRHPVLLASFVVDLIAMVFGMPRSEFPQIAHESFGGPLGGGFAFAWLFAAIPVG
ncbi:MAG TPA: MFS transporter, partial [Dermacoccus sp.]|nr:MFS transporter [Dermacoccus sp.]